MKFKCIKGMVTSDNINIIVMKNDIVKFISNDEGEVLVEGYAGWCKGHEISFTPNQFVEYFEIIGLSYIL
jgi:hypothetical protein